MSFKKLFLRFVRQYPGRFCLTIILSFSGALFNGVSTALIVPVLLDFLGQKVNLKDAPPIIQFLISPFDNLSPSSRLVAMAGAIVLAIVLKNVTNYSSTLLSSSLTRLLTADLRESGLKLLLEVDIDYYAKMKIGDIMNRLGGEIGRATAAISAVISMISNSITLLVFIGLLLWISWQLTIVSTILLSLVMLANQLSIIRAKEFGKQLSEMSKNYSVTVFEALSGIRLVKATGNEEREYQIVRKLIRDRERADFQSQANYAAITPVNEVTSIIALLLIVVLGRLFFTSQINSLSTVLLTYLLVLFRALPLISALNSARSKFSNSAASVEIVGDLLRRDNKPIMGNGSIPYTGFKEGIHFNHISFRYPDHENWVLKEADLYLPRGTTLALVGASGAGKSTLADLLPRFYDPTSGLITVDGRDLREFDVRTLRRSMGIVSQETFLFNDSVRNNIAYARLDATDEEIITAAKRANAYEFIERLPQGFNTLIGDRGVLLSGGQRQRIAIARALLQDPEILILDEATSALDTVSERLVQEAIDELSNNRTSLVIAHRLSTVQKAHQIAVLDKGQVVEVGTHENLLKQGGYYARLYAMQFSDIPQGVADTVQNSRLSKASYEIRTRLNAMLGSLRLMMDGIVDSPEEANELTNEAYSSAVRLLETLETLEYSTKAK
jgi:ATP-binding cassette, subfamily B, bacterial MsbA